MARVVEVKKAVLDQFPVYAFDNITKIPNLTQTEFQVKVFHDGVIVQATVAITEIPSSGGEYKLSFTPDKAGLWHVEVTHVPTFQVHSGTYEAKEPVVMGWHRPPAPGT